ncbi:MAG: cyclic nucleotide-binding domain-containing protein, partial [Alphaproteobacteria bacterium]
MDEFRVLLINCNTMLDTLVTAGIGILAASLKNDGVEVELFDTTFYRTAERSGDEARASTLQVKETDFAELGIAPEEGDVIDDFVRKVVSFGPDLIGLSCIEVTYPLGVELLSAVSHAGIPTVVGGPYATFAPESVIRHPAVDMVCVDEGELALAELCRRMRSGEDVSGIRNLWIKKGGKIFKNPLRPPMDMSALPYRVAFCLHLGKRERTRLESLAEPRRLRSGETLCSVGEPAEHVFIIVSGIFKLYKTLADGRRQTSRFLFSGDYLGLSEGLLKYPWTAQTVTVAEAWCLERRLFADFLHGSPELAQGLLGVAWDELESAREHMLLLAHKGAEEKIASFLLWLARRQRERGDGEPLSLPMTRRDIAD